MSPLSDIFDNIKFIHPERQASFYLWLQVHFGYSDRESIEEYIATLEEERAKSEIDTVKDEYLWCQKEPIERIRQICFEQLPVYY